jgi:ParB family chromosome partitioning protein
MPPEKPRRLGRGLEALLASRSEVQEASPTERSPLRSIPIARIRPNPYQPRKEFNEEELRELQASLRTNGLLNPIAVRPASVGEGFELIAGERRLRAAAALGWPEISAIVKEIDDQTLLTLALVENLQRADLNPMEEAEGYRQLMQNFSLTQAEVAEVTGKDRSTVANLLRLLHLPASVRRMVHERQITLGHARALLTLDDEQAIVALAKEIVARGLSVRDVEHRARQGAAPRVRKSRVPEKIEGASDSAAHRHVQEELRRHLQTDVRLIPGDDARGKIEISYYSTEDLDRLADLLLGAKRAVL